MGVLDDWPRTAPGCAQTKLLRARPFFARYPAGQVEHVVMAEVDVMARTV
ncbi:MAG: microviridin/marinostatin family tricyclic proteinase inhibitor [Armatimonadetes bacterium]|nr:microviridin/marinostatin family tricyclic proteinase inhibitor [Armatimonadota bacterium]